MKLLTHNFLSSAFLKNVKVGYPLILRVNKVEERNTCEFDAQLTKNMLNKVEYPVLVDAAKAASVADEVPLEMPGDWQGNDSFLRLVHKLLFCVEVIDGELECPESGRKFIIRDSIPNMLANEDEVVE